jgi:hypothetical protein
LCRYAGRALGATVATILICDDPQAETPPLLIIEFLIRVADVMQNYFSDVSEETIKEHFPTVYQVLPSLCTRIAKFLQLLEEMMDDGIPFCTELNTLQDMIHSRGIFAEVMEKLPGDFLPEVSRPLTVFYCWAGCRESVHLQMTAFLIELESSCVGEAPRGYFFHCPLASNWCQVLDQRDLPRHR